MLSFSPRRQRAEQTLLPSLPCHTRTHTRRGRGPISLCLSASRSLTHSHAHTERKSRPTSEACPSTKEGTSERANGLLPSEQGEAPPPPSTMLRALSLAQRGIPGNRVYARKVMFILFVLGKRPMYLIGGRSLAIRPLSGLCGLSGLRLRRARAHSLLSAWALTAAASRSEALARLSVWAFSLSLPLFLPRLPCILRRPCCPKRS